MKRMLISVFPLVVGVFLAGCDSADKFESQSSDTVAPAVLLGKNVEDNFVPSELDIGVDTLSAGGKLSISASLVDSETLKRVAGKTYDVIFTSSCIDQGKALIENVSTSSGFVSTTYEDVGCSSISSSDIITASIQGITSPEGAATGQVSLASPTISAIEFTSADPSTIALKGASMSPLPGQSNVKFIVVDSSGNPLVGKAVSFTLSANIGGVTLTDKDAITDQNGVAQTFVNSGTVNAVVRVVATLQSDEGVMLSTTSSPIAINTGLPDQNSFSVAVETFNPRAYDYNGTQVKVAVHAADQFNNLVPDGTSIAFITEGGAIEGSCVTLGGSCSAIWTSQNPRPDNGVSTILIRSMGTASFIDSNSNGLFDSTEIYSPLAEAFLDVNENGQFDDGEFFSDFNNNGVHDHAPVDSYQGVTCSQDASNLGHCNELVEVRGMIKLIMSSNTLGEAEFTVSGPVALGSSLLFYVADINGNIPPVGTVIDVTTSNGSILFGGSGVVPNQFSTNGYYHSIVTSADEDSSTGVLTVSVTPPGGSTTIRSIVVTD